MNQDAIRGKLTRSDGSHEAVEPGAPFLIGRDRRRCDLVIRDDSNVSRIHARIVFEDGAFHLCDEGSRNGTYLNSASVEGRVRLQNQDVVQIGDGRLTFSWNGEDPDGDTGTGGFDRIGETVVLAAAGEGRGGLFRRGERATAEDLKKVLARLHSLYGMTGKLASLRDITNLLEDVLEEVLRVVPVDRGTILLRGSDGSFDPVASRCRDGDGDAVEVSQGILEHVLDKRQAVLIPDATAEEEFAHNPSIMAYGMRAVACVPMIVHGAGDEGEIVGVLQVHSTQSDKLLDASDLELLLGIGSLAAVAILNSRLHAEQIQQTRLLEVIHGLECALIDETPLEEFLATALERVVAALGGNGGHLEVESPAVGHGTFRTTLGESTPHREAIEGLIEIRRDVRTQGEGYLSTQARSIHGSGAERYRMGSIISAPIHPATEAEEPTATTIGVLQIVHPIRTGFNDKTLSTLRVFCAQISTALYRKLLLDARREHRRLSTVGRLAATVVHDLKNPMGLIKGYAGMIDSNFLPKEEIHEASAVITQIADRCLNLVSGILNYARGEKDLTLETQSSAEFMSSIQLVLEKDAKLRSVELVLNDTYQSDLTLDVEKMKRVLFNLTGNAFEVLEESGRVEISCQPTTPDRLEFTVQDSGPGIPDVIRDTIFEPFVTVGKRQGSGLGLAIVREIVEAHGGSVSVHNRPEGGACFTVDLPRVPQPRSL